MAVGSVGNPQSVVLERFKPASASAPRDAAVQGWRLRLYFVSPLWVGALLLLGARISRQHEQRGYNRRSYNGTEVFLHFDLYRFFTVSRSASVIIHRTAAPIMIPFSICAEITGAALAGSAGGIERQEGWGWARLPGGSGSARLDLSHRRSVQAPASGRAYVGSKIGHARKRPNGERP